MYSKIRLHNSSSLKPVLIVTLLITTLCAPVLLVAAEQAGSSVNFSPMDCWQDLDYDLYGSNIPEYCDVGVIDNTDCDDTDDTVNPGAIESWYDGVDQDCDGANDYDQDADTYTSSQYPGHAGGTAVNEGDCDDTLFTVNPGAPEIPGDGVDQNCSGNDAVICFVDNDGDGYGTADATVIADDGICDAWQGESDNDLDCDDSSALINPGAIDIPANGIDENCDGADALEEVFADGFEASPGA